MEECTELVEYSDRTRSRSSFAPTLGECRDTFQIGPDKYAYVYEETQGQCCGKPVYQCTRGRDWDPGYLYLVWNPPRWEARQVVGTPCKHFQAVLLPSTRAFRATENDDVRTAGFHIWQCWDKRSQTWGQEFPFLTKPCQ